MKQTDGASATNAGGASAFVPSTVNAPNAGGTLEEKIRLTTMAQLNPALSANRQALPDPTVHTAGALPENSAVKPVEERIIKEVTKRLAEQSHIRVHYYVKIVVSVFLCALLLAFGIPVFMASRMTGSLSYTALGAVLIGFGLILAISVVVLLFKPPFNTPKA
ncbi:MAG: hypothetical protein HFJ64_07660 [Eggerthellaceae bacterium]|nr:hypothetical protein [Eggerthellaceae bacterium]